MCRSRILIFGPVLGVLMCLVSVAKKPPKRSLNQFNIKVKISWKAPRSSMGRPRCPKWLQVEKTYIWTFSHAVPFGALFITCSEWNLGTLFLIFLFLMLSPDGSFLDFLLILGAFFWFLSWLLAHGRNIEFCNTSYAKLQIRRVWVFNFLLNLAFFSRTRYWNVLDVFLFCFVSLVVLFWCEKVSLIDLRDI